MLPTGISRYGEESLLKKTLHNYANINETAFKKPPQIVKLVAILYSILQSDYSWGKKQKQNFKQSWTENYAGSFCGEFFQDCFSG